MTRSKYLLSWLLCAAFALGVIVAPTQAKAADEGNVCLKPNAKGCKYGLPAFQYEALLGQMLANPTPNVRQVGIDLTEIGRIDAYRLVGSIAPLYDKPNGNPIGTIRGDFNAFQVGKLDGDWVQLSATRWIRASEITHAASSTFSGVIFDRPLAYTMAWIVIPTRPSSIPGIAADKSVPMLERYQLVNIFATVTVGDWEWYLVGPGQWVEQRNLARVVPVSAPSGVKGRWVGVDLYDQVLIAYEDDRPVYATLVSTGMPKSGFGTNKGLFRIWSRLKADTMSGGMGGPDAYSLPDVPYVQYFDEQISLHGTYWHDWFGFRRSHGCVNLSVTDAHWLFNWTSGFYGDTWVYVYSSKNYIKNIPVVE